MDIDKKISEIKEYMEKKELELLIEIEDEAKELCCSIKQIEEKYFQKKAEICLFFEYECESVFDEFNIISSNFHSTALSYCYLNWNMVSYSHLNSLSPPPPSSLIKSLSYSAIDKVKKTEELLCQTEFISRENIKNLTKICEINRNKAEISCLNTLLQQANDLDKKILDIRQKNSEFIKLSESSLNEYQFSPQLNECLGTAEFLRLSYMKEYVFSVMDGIKESREFEFLHNEKNQFYSRLKQLSFEEKQELRDIVDTRNCFDEIAKTLKKKLNVARDWGLGIKKQDNVCKIVGLYRVIDAYKDELVEFFYSKLSAIEKELADEMEEVYKSFYSVNKKKIDTYIKSLDEKIHQV